MPITRSERQSDLASQGLISTHPGGVTPGSATPSRGSAFPEVSGFEPPGPAHPDSTRLDSRRRVRG